MAIKKRPDELSRPERRGVPGPLPLLAIAGLPPATALAAAATINNDADSRWRAVAAPYAAADANLYANAAATRRLADRACQFALRTDPAEDGVPMPSRLAVAYVAQDGAEALWDIFGHATWPLPLHHPDWKFPKGRHWRHDIETVNSLLRRAVTHMEVTPARELQLRLEARRSGDILLLPGRNFELADGGRLVERFRGFVAGRLDVAAVEAGVEVKRFPYERLKHFYDLVGGRNAAFAIDRRDIVFAKSHNGQHGGGHGVAKDVAVTDALLRRILESRFRFGAALPSGFQHDAQLENGRLFRNERFQCAAKGPTDVNGTHANVYPSDVVT